MKRRNFLKHIKTSSIYGITLPYFETFNSSCTLSIVNGKVAALELVEKARSCAGEMAFINRMNLTLANRLIKKG